MIVDEEIGNECVEARQMVWFVDVTIEARPDGDLELHGATKRAAISASAAAGSARIPPTRAWRRSVQKFAFISFFNAGVRALDIRDPYHPTEVGYFIPSITGRPTDAA